MVTELRRSRGRPRKEEGPDPARILQAAITAFACHGWEGTNLRQVAEAAGVDAALIARRYDGKMGLWRAIVDHVSQRLKQVFAEATLPADATHQQRLAHSIDAFVRLNLSMPDLGRFFIDQIARPGLRRDYVIERMWAVFRDAMTPIMAAAQEGAPRRRDPAMTVALLLGAVAMPLMMRSVALGDMDDPAQAEAFVDHVLTLFA